MNKSTHTAANLVKGLGELKPHESLEDAIERVALEHISRIEKDVLLFNAGAISAWTICEKYGKKVEADTPHSSECQEALSNMAVTLSTRIKELEDENWNLRAEMIQLLEKPRNERRD